MRSTVLQEALHIVVIAQALENQGFRRILKDETQLEAHPAFVPIIAQFPQADAAVKMRLAEVPLGFGYPSADRLPIRRWHRANRL